MSNNPLDLDMKSFLKRQIEQISDNIDSDPRKMLPKKSEKFVQMILKDDAGNLVENEEVHNLMHQFRRIAHKKGFRKILILGAFGLGKSLISGTCVLMYDCTTKKVEDVKVGDLLMGPDSKPRKVLSLGTEKEQSYKITLKNKDTFSCNSSHKIPFYVSNRWNGYKKGDQIIMTIQEYLKLPEWVKKNSLKIQKSKGVYFKFQSVPISPYLYGLWLGDGHCTGLSFTINDDDMIIADYLWDWADNHKFSFKVDEEESNCTRYSINHGPQNCESYTELNFIRSSCLNGKRIDKRYLYNSKFIRLNLLAGLLDTDGYLIDNCYEIVTKWIGLRDDILFLCRSLGLSVTHGIKIVNDVDYYRIYISGNTHLIPCKTRKKASQRKQIKNPLVYGFDVEDIGIQTYYGFTLDEDHLFLQDDFTIHHNSEQMCIGLCLEKIAKDPNVLIKIVHVSDKEAVNRVRAVSDYIKNDRDFKRVCPHVQPTAIWGQEKFIVKRKTISKDPTMQAFSVLSSSLGGRAHFIVYDDVNDLKSAVLEPGTRENIEMMIKNVWDTRLIPQRSEVVMLGNKWHENDIYTYVQNNPTWAWMSIAVAEDKESLIYEDSFGKKRNIPLWTKYGKKEYENKHISMGDRDYNRGYRLIAYSDHDKSFPSFETCCLYGIKPVDLIGDMRDWVFAGSVDFSGVGRKGTTLTIGAINKETSLKIPVETFTFNNPSDLAETMIDTWQRWGTEIYLCENNAVQEAIMDLLRTVIDSKKLNKKFSKINIKIEGFNTGRNKLDPTKGLPSLEKEMKNKEWTFCFPKKYTPVDQYHKDVNCRMYKELLYHPFFETTDLVMTTWFLREAFKRLIMKSSCDCFY